MMSDSQDFQNVKERMGNDFALTLNEFNSHNTNVGSLLSEEEKMYDQENWFEPKMASIRDFMKTTRKWIAENHKHVMQKEAVQQKNVLTDDLQEAVKPDDSVSQVGVSNDSDHSPCESHVSRTCGSYVSRSSTISRVSSTRAKQEAEYAALLERAAGLKKREQLELELAKIKQHLELETAIVQAEKEELDLETPLAESQAKLNVLKEYEGSEEGLSCHLWIYQEPEITERREEGESWQVPLTTT